MENSNIILAVKYWLEHSIIGYNFCPFAKKVFINDSIHYLVAGNNQAKPQDSKARGIQPDSRDSVSYYLQLFMDELSYLDQNPKVDTSLLIMPYGLESFFDYLDFLAMAENLSVDSQYEGIYQLASFHPDYCFAGENQKDVSNYTNRSPFPIIHIIREEQIEGVLKHYAEPELIPQKNIEFANKKGAAAFEKILSKCQHISKAG